MPGSLGFGDRELHHLAPLLGFLSEELAEVCRRAQKRRTPISANFNLRLGSTRAEFISVLIDE
jgi:hypothetical protein